MRFILLLSVRRSFSLKLGSHTESTESSIAFHKFGPKVYFQMTHNRIQICIAKSMHTINRRPKAYMLLVDAFGEVEISLMAF